MGEAGEHDVSSLDGQGSVQIGDRLRAIRRQQGMSLHDVEARSGQEFKASVLGAYERGERALSVSRLLRLAELYDVPSDQLLPRGADIEIDLTKGAEEGSALTIDLVRLNQLEEPDAEVLARYAATIQLQRQDFNGRMLTIRRDDVRVLAAVLGRSPASTSWDYWSAADQDGPPRRTSALRCRAEVSTPSPTQLKVLVPGNHLMVTLLGQRDELLKLVEEAFPVAIHVRGNEITVTGEAADAERVGRLFEELVVLLETGHHLDADGLGRSIEMLKADQRPTEVLGTEVLRGRKPIRPKTTGQKRFVDAVQANTVTFAIGVAGTGKSYLAVALAVQALQAKVVNRIILTRPAVEAGERLGFLPGDVLAKVDPYLRPLYDALYDMLDAEVVSRLMDRGTIEVAPLAFMRGRTLNDSFIILDEAQNTTAEQMKMFLTRLGFGSKVVVTGDVTQIDLPEGRGRSGLGAVRDILDGINGVAFVELDARDVVRHRIVQDIVNAYERASE